MTQDNFDVSGLKIISADGQELYTIEPDEAAEAWVINQTGAASPIEPVPEIIWQAKVCLETGNMAEAKAALTKAGYTVSEIEE